MDHPDLVQCAAIFVAPENASDSTELCREACDAHGWKTSPDRTAILDPDHPDQGLPVVLFTSTSDQVHVLVVPTWEEIARGLFGGVYHTEPNVKGKNSRMVGTGLLTARRFFEELAERAIRIHVVAEGRTFDAAEVAAHLRDAYEPLMGSAREWDATLSRKIRAGQDTAWAEGKRVGRPPRGKRETAQPDNTQEGE